MKKLIANLASLKRYGMDCDTCDVPAAVENPRCENHKPFVPSDPDDAALVLNRMIEEARVLMRPEVTVVVGSLEGIKVIVYHDRVSRWERDFSGGPSGEWKWKESGNMDFSMASLLHLADGLSAEDRATVHAAIRRAKEAR